MAPHYNTRVNSLLCWIETGGHCWYCGVELRPNKFILEHQTPAKRGGKNTKDNIVAACYSCNNRKGQRTVEEFRSDCSITPIDVPRFTDDQRQWLLDNGVDMDKISVQFYGEKHTFPIHIKPECEE